MSLNNKAFNKLIVNILWSMLMLIGIFLSSCKTLPPEQPLQAKVYSGALVYEVSGDFADIEQQLVETIEDQGIVISYISHAGAMLKRTADSVDDSKQVYDNAEILLFCKAEIAHLLARENPHNLILCPHAIGIYSLKSEQNKVFLSIRRAPEGVKAYQAVIDLLVGIIEEIIEENS